MRESEQKIIFSLKDISSIAVQLVDLMPICTFFLCEGPLGAGKTTLIKEILYHKGVTGPITSPTFTYVNIYENSMGERFYHFDLYRINSQEEFLAAGFDELLYTPHSWSFIEWPAIIMPLFDHAFVTIKLEYAGYHERILTYQVVP